MTSLLKLWGGLMALLFPQKKERSKNRGSEPDRLAVRFARMQRTLIEISNKTRSQMDDAEFRDFAQDAAHLVIEEIGRVK